MARGRDEHQARVAAVKGLGRVLARRARSSCELCEDKGVSLDPTEVPPAPEEPEVERTILVCGRCQSAMGGGDMGARDWRFLESVMWSELAPVQVAAVRLLRRLAEAPDAHWARDALDQVYLSDEVREWVDAS